MRAGAVCRQVGGIALVLLTWFRAAALAAEEGVPPDRRFAIGVKLGLIPPVLAVPEILGRPAPHVAVGIFGIATDSGIGSGGHRLSLGAELAYEFREGRRNTPYIALAYGYYHADTDANGFYETSSTLYFTGGYTVKEGMLELTFGGGLLVMMVDDIPPCVGFCISGLQAPPVLPTFDLEVRFAPF